MALSAGFTWNRSSECKSGQSRACLLCSDFPQTSVQSAEINEGEMFNKPNRLLWKTPLLS